MTFGNLKQKRKTRYLNFLFILLLVAPLFTVLVDVPMETARADVFIPFGLSGYPRNTATLQEIIDVMQEYHMNTYRMSFNPSWFDNKPNPYSASLIQYYLDNTPSSFILIIDRNHLYPPNSESAAEYRANRVTARNDILTTLGTSNWGNNPRVWVECFNEYTSSDYLSQLQWMTDAIRSAGYTNVIVNNKWNTNWGVSVIDDDSPGQWTGYHYYFNTWSVSSAVYQMNLALQYGVGGIVNTEIGADYNEGSSFTDGTVGELNQFIEWSYENQIGNTIWMCYGLQNWEHYQDHGLDLDFLGEVEEEDYSPSYSDIDYSSTVASSSCDFSVKWTDDNGLAGYIFSTNNSGSWANTSFTTLSGTEAWANETVTLNAVGGTLVQYRWYCRDTYMQWSKTAIRSLTVQASNNYPTFSQITISTVYTTWDCDFSVRWADIEGLSGYIFGTNNTGSWVNDTWADIGAGDPKYAYSTETKTIAASSGETVVWRVWCNDTDDNWSDTQDLFAVVEPEGSYFFDTYDLYEDNIDLLVEGEPYFLDSNGTITAFEARGGTTIFTVDATGVSETYMCSNGLGRPVNVRGATFSYNLTLDQVRLLVTHASEAEVEVDWSYTPTLTIVRDTILLSEGVVLRTRGNDVRFTAGTDLELYRVRTQNIALWLDATFRENYYVRYCIYVESPTSVNLTVNRWFESTNGRATLTITSPTATDIDMGFFSPTLISASVIGAKSQTWNASTQTLSFTVTTDVSASFTILASVTETREDVLTPEILDFSITNMEGCGNWVFAEEDYYSFESTYYEGTGWGDLETCSIRFSDGVHTVTAVYDVDAETIALTDGSDVVKLILVSVENPGSNSIVVTFGFYFEELILDAYDVDVLLRATNYAGLDSGWVTIAGDYFNIYNYGGLSQTTSEGVAGRTEGGDVYELYTDGGDYAPADIFEENFDSSEQFRVDWRSFTINDGVIKLTPDYTSPIDSFFDDNMSQLYLEASTGAGTNYATVVRELPFTVSGGSFMFQAYLRLDDTGTAFYLQNTSETYFLYCTFLSDKIQCVDGASMEDSIIYTTDVWYNVTLDVDLASSTYDAYFSNSSWSGSYTDLDFLGGDASDFRWVTLTSQGSDNVGVFDGVKAWRDWAGGYGGTVMVSTIYRNLQHVFAKFKIQMPVETITQAYTIGLRRTISIPGFYSGLETDVNFYFALGYCHPDDEWVRGLECVVTPTNTSRIHSTQLNVEWAVDWFWQGEYVKTDYIYSFPLMQPETVYMTTSLFLDVWFNKVNASSWVGGRLQSEYYAMKDSSHVWLRWATGSEWGAMVDRGPIASFFHENTYDDETVYGSQLKLMNFTFGLHAESDHYINSTDWTGLSFTTVDGVMRGIDTPAEQETRMHSMPQTGIWGTILGTFRSVGTMIVRAVTFGAFSSLGFFYNGLDYVFGLLGYSDLMPSIADFISTGYSWMTVSLGYIVDIVPSVLALMVTVLPSFITHFIGVLNGLVTISQSFFYVLGYAASGGVSIYETLTPFIPLAAIGYLLWLASMWEKRGPNAVIDHLQKVISILTMIFNFLLSIFNTVLERIFDLIEAIPVAE